MKVTLFSIGEIHYQASLVNALAKQDIKIDLICSDDLENFLNMANSNVNILNLRGSGDTTVNLLNKINRVIRFYFRVIVYTLKTDSIIFHIQWDNKILFIDRVFLLLFYHVLGKKVIYTAHNVDNYGRYGKSPFINKITLNYFYRNIDHLIVHTLQSKEELLNHYGIDKNKISVIPHGINLQVPISGMDSQNARMQLGINKDMKVLLFFGGIQPYKGVDLLLQAFKEINEIVKDYFLIIAGRPQDNKYIVELINYIELNNLKNNIFLKLEFIHDKEIELYFKAADCLILPYKKIYQSGVLYLAYGFGLPVIANNVGNFNEEIINLKTGLICYENTSQDLAKSINQFFKSELYSNKGQTSEFIKEYAKEKYSWDIIANQTVKVYNNVINFI